MHDSFAVIRWEAAGVGPGTVGVLWSISVAAEGVVFLFIGGPFLNPMVPARHVKVAAGAGIVPSVHMAEPTYYAALAVVHPRQPRSQQRAIRYTLASNG